MSEEAEVLTSEILADARRRADRAIQRARQEAEKIVADARKEAELAGERIMAEARQRIARQEAAARARALQELDHLRRLARQRILDRVRDETRRRLAELGDSAAHRDVLVRLAALAIAEMAGDEFFLVLRPEDRARWGEQLPGAVEAAVKEQQGRAVSVRLDGREILALGGLKVIGAGGRQEADQTFDGRLARLWEQICAELMSMIAAQEGELK